MTPDLPARERIRTALGETLFVEAGAGTGKTAALVTRIVELVATRTATLTEIAAITFTDAAAAELRGRVRQRLEEAAVTEGCPERRAACGHAAAHVDQAAILTLHGFAQRLLAEYPLEAGLPPGFEVADEVSSQLAFERRWSELLDALLAEPGLAEPLLDGLVLGLRVDHLREVAQVFDRDYDRLEDAAVLPGPGAEPEPVGHVVAALATICDCRGWCTDPSDKLATHLDGLSRLCALLVVQAESSVDCEGVRGDAPDGCEGVRGDAPDGCEVVRGNAPDGCEGATAPTSQGAGRAVYWLSSSDPQRREVRMQARPNATGFPRGPLGQARTDRERLRLLAGARLRLRHGQSRNWGGRVAEVRQRLAELADRCDALLGARRRHALAPLLARLREATLEGAARRAEQGRLEFHDLLVLARALLRDHPEVRERLARRYRFLLVDEFQDTDPLQVEIALRLTGNEAGRLFFVGDAQQSIYRFRRADIATCERVRARFREGAVTLSRNHRSVPSILDWVNATFGPLLTSGDGVGQARHRPLDGHRPGLGDSVAVRLLGGPVDGRAAEVRHRESAAIATAIAEIHGRWLVGDDPLPARYRDIAVLMPARTALPQLERALEDAGIPFRVEARSLVYATQEVRELLAVLRAVDDPTDQVAIVAALRSPALGCTDRDLVDWRAAGGRWSYLTPAPVEDHVVAAGLARLSALHERRWWDTPSGIVEAAIRQLRLLELACAHRRPREAWQRLRYVLDQARAFTERSASLRDLCAWIQRQADERARVVEQVLPDDDDDAVRVLTVHGAKGLEFPVAILCGLAAPRRPLPGPVVAWDDEGRAHVRLRKGFETAGFEAAYALQRRLDTLEEARLLYVAATRARDHLVVGVHHRPTAKGDESAAERLWSLAQGTPELWRPLVPAEDAQLLPLPTQAAPVQEPPPPREQWLAERKALITAHRMAPVLAAAAIASEMADGDGSALGRTGDEDERPPWRRGRAGTALGRAVHAVLQTVDLATGEGVDALAAAQAAAEGLPGSGPQIARLARSALFSRTVQDALARRCWREVSVAGAVEGILVEGIVDLLHEHPDGLVVVDYRTDPLPAGLDPHLGELVARCTPQVAAYVLALEAALDRPVVACRLVFVDDGPARERVVADLAAAKATVRAHLRALVTP
ncbi:MAG: UvrD-helicase domain-containing protein [Egibacteraceae bacterium]